MTRRTALTRAANALLDARDHARERGFTGTVLGFSVAAGCGVPARRLYAATCGPLASHNAFEACEIAASLALGEACR